MVRISVVQRQKRVNAMLTHSSYAFLPLGGRFRWWSTPVAHRSVTCGANYGARDEVVCLLSLSVLRSLVLRAPS